MFFPLASRAHLSSSYKAKGITLNGTNNTYARAAQMTGVADTNSLTFSMWYTIEAGGGTFRQIQDIPGDRFQIYLDTGNHWVITGSNSVGVTIVSEQSVPTYSASPGTWHHIAVACQLGASPIFQLYIDGAVVTTTSSALTALTNINFSNGTNWWTGSNAGTANWWNGSVFDLWFDTTYLDLSVAGNLAKFRNATTGKPVNLGSTGQTPIGSSPLLYQHVGSGGTAANFATNLGTGGGMTAAGTAIALSATSPTD